MTVAAMPSLPQVLLTRPQALAERLLPALQAAGLQGLILPAIEILPPPQPALLLQTLEHYRESDGPQALAIFVSPSAVLQVAAVLAGRGWPKGLALAAVGQGTAALLRECSGRAVLAPADGGDGAALLALPEMQSLAQRTVLLCRGQRGRESLVQGLRAAGAQLEVLCCYARVCPQPDALALQRLQHSLSAEAGDARLIAWVLGSAEAANNLQRLLPDQGRCLAALPVFVPHARVAQVARECGWLHPRIYAGGDAALLQAVQAWRGYNA